MFRIEMILPQELLEEELGKKSVFKDEASLEFSYVPEKLPQRERQYKELAQVFKSLLSLKPPSYQCIIQGDIGTGKTLLSKKFGSDFEVSATKRNIALQYIHINCRQMTSDYVIWVHIAREIGIEKTSGYPLDYLLDKVKRHLKSTDKILLVTLDEIDYYVSMNNDTNLLYEFSRSLEDKRLGEKSRLNLICISRNENFFNLLDPATQSSFKKYIISLNKYSEDELKEILEYRASIALWEDITHPEVISFISKIAAQKGDARFAIELLLTSGKIVDNKEETKILPDHVRAAKAHVLPIFSEELLNNLNLQELLILYSVSYCIKGKQSSYVYTKEVFETYKMHCELQNLASQSYVSFHSHLQRLMNLGCIDLETDSRDGERGGKLTKIYLEDIPADVLCTKLESYIKEKERD